MLQSQFYRKQQVAWRVRVLDSDGKMLDDKGLTSLVVELSNGKKIELKFKHIRLSGRDADRFLLVRLVGDFGGRTDRLVHATKSPRPIPSNRPHLGAVQDRCLPAHGCCGRTADGAEGAIDQGVGDATQTYVVR